MTMWISYEISSITVSVLLQINVCVNTSISLHWKTKARKLILLLYLSLCFSCSDDKFRAMTSSFSNFSIFMHLLLLIPIPFNQLGNMWKNYSCSLYYAFQWKYMHVYYFTGSKTLNGFIERIAPLNLMCKHWKLLYSRIFMAYKNVCEIK